jgi:ribosome-associated translation inhibitor RaiA
MTLETQITLRNLAPSLSLESAIREKAGRLNTFCSGVTRCKVAVALEGQHKTHGRQFSVSVEVHVPDGDFIVTHHHDEDVHVAVRDAFQAARRRLEDFARMRRGDVKHHDTPL